MWQLEQKKLLHITHFKIILLRRKMSFPTYVTLLIFIIAFVNLKEANASGFECQEEPFDDNCNSLDLDRAEYYYLYYNGNFVNGMKYPLDSPQEYIQCFGQPHRREFVRVCQCTNDGIFDPILQNCRSKTPRRSPNQQLDRQSREKLQSPITTTRAPFIDPFDESN